MFNFDYKLKQETLNQKVMIITHVACSLKVKVGTENTIFTML